MNLDDFLNGDNGINVNAETLPQVYGLEDDVVVNKCKRLVKGSIECDKDHEVVELIRAEADSDIEALVLTHLVNKFIMEQVIEQSKDTLSSLSFALAFGLSKAQSKLNLTDEQNEGLLLIVTEAIENTINNQ